jgi:hypothetical protein
MPDVSVFRSLKDNLGFRPKDKLGFFLGAESDLNDLRFAIANLIFYHFTAKRFQEDYGHFPLLRLSFWLGSQSILAILLLG